ncbi:MAG: helix-turn-helix domain-containing protein [Halobacteria archaeon]|nr:helix-turn-helix domain-containing protein [Halobacteria archaeon]
MTPQNYNTESTTDWDTDSIFDLLGDECARTILSKLSIKEMSAKELANNCNVSLPTIYRRVNALSNHGLINEKTRIGEDGSHYNIYENNFNRMSIEAENGKIKVSVNLEDGKSSSEGIVRYPNSSGK